MENNNQSQQNFFEKNSHFLILMLMLVIVIALSVTILLSQIGSNYQAASVVSTQVIRHK